MSKEKYIEEFLDRISKNDLVAANEKLNLAVRETLQGIINNKKEDIANKLSEKAQTLAIKNS